MKMLMKCGVAAMVLMMLVAAGHAQVQLVYACPFEYAVSGMTWNEADFRVHVENICSVSNQNVFIHYDTGMGTWASVSMGLEGDYGDHSTYTLTLSGQHKEFVVGFTDLTTGTTCWDNNGGLNYEIHSRGASYGIDAGVVGGNVGLIEAERYLTFTGGRPSSMTVGIRGSIVVQDQNTYLRQVGIRYTTDGWATFHTVAGTFDYTMTTGCSTSDMEVYTFDVPNIGGTGLPVEFAVWDYEVLGLYPVAIVWYWDNNFTLNYTLPLGTAPIH